MSKVKEKGERVKAQGEKAYSFFAFHL